MVVTLIGSYPLCMGPIHEVVEVFYGEIKTNKVFITNKECWLFRSIEIALISVIAYLVPSFSDILSFNILFHVSRIVFLHLQLETFRLFLLLPLYLLYYILLILKRE